MQSRLQDALMKQREAASGPARQEMPPGAPVLPGGTVPGSDRRQADGGSYPAANVDLGQHRVRLQCAWRDGWHVRFFDLDGGLRLKRRFRFRSWSKLRELAQHGNALSRVSDREAFDCVARRGFGYVVLTLTNEQFCRLQKSAGAQIDP
jgi:hypothetical protein